MDVNSNNIPLNILNLYPDNYGSECGYCKKKGSSYSFGTVINSYPVDKYERMMKDGWRRCGNYVYIPNLEKSCCKIYTHRLNVEDFQINKEQKKVMKRFRKYLSGEYEQNLEKNKKKEEKKEEKKGGPEVDKTLEKIEKILIEYIKQEKYIDIINKYINSFDKNNLIQKLNQTHVRKNTNKKFKFDYSIDFIFIIRKIIESTVDKNKIKFNEYDKLETDLFNHFKSFYNPENEILELSLNTGHINIIDKLKTNTDNIKTEKEIKNEIKIEQNKKEKKDKKMKIEKKENKTEQKEKYTFDYFNEIVNEPEIYLPLKHVYTLELTDKIKMNDEKYKVYKKYQKIVHKESDFEISKQDYNDSWGLSNLVDNKGIKFPEDLAKKTKHPEIYPKKYGCYNLIHRIDGKIVAVGIIDILPNYLSSVYLYYDTDYQFLDLGVVTAILEIEYARSFHDLIDNNFKYYTLGFYSENVQKLRYKGFYHPSQILDRFTMNYVFLKDVQNILKEGKHVPLSKEPKNPNYEFIKNDEINYYINSLTIREETLFTKKILNMNDYINSLRNKEAFLAKFKRFIELIPKDLIKQFSFFAKFSLF